jgi:hypothetical protein
VIAPLLGGAFLGALFSFAFGQRLFAAIATPNTARFFGFESIAGTHLEAPDRTWAIVVVVAYVLVHLVGVRLDQTRDVR